MKKILVAEDNDSNFILMTYILKKYYAYERIMLMSVPGMARRQ